MTVEPTARTILFDLDGTLININSIAHLIGDWDAFAEASILCPANEPIAEFARLMQLHYELVVCTGKGEAYRNRVCGWLSLQGIIPDLLLMRPANNFQSDAELKPALLRAALGEGWKGDILFAIEDRDKMVDAWRALGITCFQCAPSLY